jgi:hypothetical protein
MIDDIDPPLDVRSYLKALHDVADVLKEFPAFQKLPDTVIPEYRDCDPLSLTYGKTIPHRVQHNRRLSTTADMILAVLDLGNQFD